tara:strand:+ start:173 stop:910 length:738 start_codon:yes stop_codon:yes gene_type:complete
MTLLSHRYFKNFKHYLLRGYFKIPLMITLTSYIRFVYFFHFKKNFKSFHPLENDVIKRNTKYTHINIFNFFKIYNYFHPGKKLLRFLPIKALSFLKPLNMRVLTIGPRDESELFALVALGFQLKNITGLDIQKYSNLITLGDAIDLPFEDNSFDLVIIGKMIVYSDKPDKVINETIRVLKNGGIVSMFHSHIRDHYYTDFKFNTSKYFLDFFGKKLDDIFFRYHTFDKDTKSKKGISNIVISIKK